MWAFVPRHSKQSEESRREILRRAIARLRMTIIVGLFSLNYLIFFSPHSYAQEISLDDATKEVCNQAVRNIYEEILKAKDKYQELSDFDERVLSKNQYGIYSITYQYKDPRSKAHEPYEFRIIIVGMDDKPYHYPGFEDQHYGFPALNLRVSSFIRRDRRVEHFDIDRPINKNNEILYEYQQQFLPFQVILKSEKDTFKVGERIEFEVIIKNQTQKSFKVKSLGEESLFFTIDHREWGTKPSSPSQNSSKEVVIDPGGSIHRGFKGDSFETPRDIEILCTYNAAYKGILPFGSLKIKIVK